jgi:GNAT superfamily N-acetyltransferase
VEASRAARPDDLPRISELAAQLRAELAPMKGGDLWAAHESTPEPFEASYRARLERDDAEVVVGEYAGVVVGYAVVVVDQLRDGRRLGLLTDLYVEPEAREVGVGEAMVDRVIAWCAARGCAGIDAVALPGHRATKNFFEEFGFTARALVMHRRLDRS